MVSGANRRYLSVVSPRSGDGQPSDDDSGRAHILHFRPGLRGVSSDDLCSPAYESSHRAPAPVISLASLDSHDTVNEGIADLVGGIYDALTQDIVDCVEMKLRFGTTIPGIAPTSLLLLRPPNPWIRRIPGVQCVTDDGSGGLIVHYRGNDGPVCLEYDASLGRLAIPVVRSEIEAFLSQQGSIAGGIDVVMFTLAMRRSEYSPDKIFATYFSRVRTLDVVAPEGLTALTTIYSGIGHKPTLRKFVYFGQQDRPTGPVRY